MNHLPLPVRLRHRLILSRWQRWWFPSLCLLPYLLCLAWMLSKGLYWVAQVLLAPLLMGALMALLTFWLAEQEFRTSRRR
ncbi:hypothetical protein [Cyanobium sp. WAJ14-Wanaka]|uniref:hypothetical protein n=1 Tax=Cyanobium sp. WAJ14-Wanaka TaxID=2823725 RepID=UPI0020CE173D|nr:hypothetical protein [Cyanobium sp. WAJ14-Wanaka]MCP9775641.1 hypothetical protein [Cyanobium sp. WAJ14-Wanaka]